MVIEKNDALHAEQDHRTIIESASDYIENFDILETITNVGNDEIFTPKKMCDALLDALPDEVWHNPDYKWLNPCSKNGVFEREVALRLDVGLKDIIPDIEKRRKHILQNMIYAIGLTKFTSHVARRTLYYCNDAHRKCDGIKAKDGSHYVNGYSIGNGTWFKTSDGNILTPTADHDFTRGDKCPYCGIKKDSPYVDLTQREQYAYEFIHHHKLNLQRELSKKFFKGDINMKFDIIIGNPPYQLSDGGGTGSSAKPIYNLFVENALALNPKYLSMIIPSRWFSGGKGLDEFRNLMINDKHIYLLHDYINDRECFPTVSVEGGVCFFVRDADYNGKCEIVTHAADGTISTSNRYLSDSKDIDILIRNETSLNILKKVQEFKESSFESLVSTRRPFGFSNIEDKYIVKNEKKAKYRVLSRINSRREMVLVSEQMKVTKNKEIVDSWKIFISKADGAAGQIGNPIPARIIGKPELGKPNDMCTETFLCIAPFKTKEEAENVLQYMNTRFFRFLVGIRKNKNMTQSTYKFVPILDFNKKWTDEELFKKYNFSKEEIDFIVTHITENI